MNLGEIRAEVFKLVQEAGFTTVEVDSAIVECYQFVADTVLIPDLKRMDSVQTVAGAAWISLGGLAGGFSGKLRRVIRSDGSLPRIYANLEELMEHYSVVAADEIGDVEAVALEGSTLWYQKIPAVAETLTVLYYQDPSVLEDDEESPDYLPGFLHRPLLVSGAAYIMFNRLEDGLDGEKVNTASQLADFNRGIASFRAYSARRRMHFISSRWDV
jgi:hypothetical protein